MRGFVDDHWNADVAVVGAGPVGLTAALLLAGHGLRVEVIERRVAPCVEPRAVSLDDEGLRIWQACGLSDALREDWGGGEDGQRICSYLDRRARTFMAIHQRTSELGHPHAVSIHQGRIEAKLLRAAQDHPSIRVRLGLEVGSIEQGEDAVALRGIDASGRDFAIGAPWAIACDGAGGVVRRQLGIPERPIASVGGALDRPWLIANLVDHGEPGHVTIRCGAGCAAVTMPLPHGCRRVEVELAVDDEGDWLHDEAEVRRRLRHGWDGAADAPIAGISRRRFRAAVAARWRQGRIFLAGDAAHVTPPFAGQGLCAGLRDVANLTFKIAGVHQGWLVPAVLDTYEQERRPHVERMTRLACRLGRVMSPPTRGAGDVLHAALRAVGRVPVLGERWLLRGPRIQPTLSRGLLMPARGSREPGRYLPQPVVIAPDGRHVPFDALLGARFACVLLGGGARVDRSARQRVADAARAWSGTSRATIEPLPRQAIGAVLLEDIDFRDPQGRLRRRYGVGSALLVRPDRVVHSHVPATWLASHGLDSPQRRRLACGHHEPDARTLEAGAPRPALWAAQSSRHRWPAASPTARIRAS